MFLKLPTSLLTKICVAGESALTLSHAGLELSRTGVKCSHTLSHSFKVLSHFLTLIESALTVLSTQNAHYFKPVREIVKALQTCVRVCESTPNPRTSNSCLICSSRAAGGKSGTGSQGKLGSHVDGSEGGSHKSGSRAGGSRASNGKTASLSRSRTRGSDAGTDLSRSPRGHLLCVFSMR